MKLLGIFQCLGVFQHAFFTCFCQARCFFFTLPSAFLFFHSVNPPSLLHLSPPVPLPLISRLSLDFSFSLSLPLLLTLFLFSTHFLIRHFHFIFVTSPSLPLFCYLSRMGMSSSERGKEYTSAIGGENPLFLSYVPLFPFLGPISRQLHLLLPCGAPIRSEVL